MTSRKLIYEKYFNSNIFNTNPVSTETGPKVRMRVSQSTLDNTKNDIFNIEKLPPKTIISKRGVKRHAIYAKIYGSDIFCRTQRAPKKKRDGVKKIRNANNFSSCMESMKNIEEYSKNLKNYAKVHRAEKKEYNPDKYLPKESASERYYKEIYDPHGSVILPKTNLSIEPESKELYAQKKKNLKKEITQYNDCGVDHKKKPGEHEGQANEKTIYVKKKNVWTDISGYHFVESKTNPENNCKINKQMNLQSHLFKGNEDSNQKEKKNNSNLNIEQINSRIQEEKQKNDRYERYHIGEENKKRDLSNNDRDLWGSVYSKWEKTNIDWRDPHTEIMFGAGIPKDVNDNFGPNGPNAFQRKLNNLADTKNIDTINEEKKVPINNIQKPLSNKAINGEGMEKIEEIVNEIPNLPDDKKCKIKMEATTSVLNPEVDWDRKAKTLNKFYTNPNFGKYRKHSSLITKIGAKNEKKVKEVEKKSGHDYQDYVLTYPTRSKFEKYNEGEIKKLFGTKGLNIYDIQKNMFDKGTYNTIKFKVRENEDEVKLNDRMNEISKEFEKQNYKVLINKQDKKDFQKKNINFVSNPGQKLGIIKENIETKNKAKLSKIPEKIKYKNSFSKQYGLINFKYKKGM